MKKSIKQFILSACTVTLMGGAHLASADINSDTETLLNWAENTYPDLFPSHQGTQSLNPWLYRFYPETGIYAGVNVGDNGAYVLGGPYGSNPVRVAGLPELIAQIIESGGNSSIPGCNTSGAPPGLSYTQSGNVVNISTGASCVALPTANNFCVTPQQPAETGISVLTTSTGNSPSFGGISAGSLGPNPLQSFADGFANSKHCTMHVPADTANLIINSNVCFDITAQSSGFAGVPGITITPPVTMSLNTTSTNVIVPDCFATDADTIYNTVTDESWINEEGVFTPLGTGGS
ncbi:hypothetical protein [Nitrosomonas sp.]|uniref:hypothetical protein n=1 Tax=Nitrosomonas sp. TaxID=42353 RepID=UPI0025D95E8A|nr:hypothetical protein [Nitrosomonas sp.]